MIQQAILKQKMPHTNFTVTQSTQRSVLGLIHSAEEIRSIGQAVVDASEDSMIEDVEGFDTEQRPYTFGKGEVAADSNVRWSRMAEETIFTLQETTALTLQILGCV